MAEQSPVGKLRDQVKRRVAVVMDSLSRATDGLEKDDEHAAQNAQYVRSQLQIAGESLQMALALIKQIHPPKAPKEAPEPKKP